MLAPRPPATLCAAPPAHLAVDLAFGRFTLAIPHDARMQLARGWLALGIAALAASGLLAVLLVLSRTPWLAKLFPVAGFFHAALVAHVDLSVLVWFVACGGVLWSLNSTRRWLPLGVAALALCAAGTATIAVAPFFGGVPIMANYVPVIESRPFLAGLVLFGAGLVLLVGRGLFASPLVGVRLDGPGALRFGLNGAIVATAVALLAFAWSYAAVPGALDGKAYYELLFWGGGHVLQFMHTILMLVVAWLLLRATGSGLRGSETMQRSLFALTALPLLGVPLLLALAPASPAYVIGYSELMRWGGIGCIPLLLLVVASMPRTSTADITTRTLRSVLWWSLLLFAAGGILGFLIRGSNTVIPAHYHGSIVGVTLAYMGVFYLLLPRLGYPLALPRTARWQPLVYGVGQVMHIAGLAWTGGHGAQRKTVGTAEGLSRAQEIIGMGLMGTGSLVAVIGGTMFLVVVLVSVHRARRARG